MRIQHNIAAQNSYRQLGGNNGALSKNLEKLSSGYKINRAGDDAAGLAISEKMRSQITGLKKAQDNANDGISLVQTAEGALTEVHSMLNRMVELADQSANGTFDDELDRDNLQKEVASLKSEIDRISESTNFNGIKLLDGSMGGEGTTGVTIKGGSAALATEKLVDDAGNDISLSFTGINKDDSITIDSNDTNGTEGLTKTYNKTESDALGRDVYDYHLTLKAGKSYTQEDLDKLMGDSELKINMDTDRMTVSVAAHATPGTAVRLAGTGTTRGAGTIKADTARKAIGTLGKIEMESTVAGAKTNAVTFTQSKGEEGVTFNKESGAISISLDFQNKTYSEDDLNKMLEKAGATAKFTSGDIEKGTLISATGNQEGNQPQDETGANVTLILGDDKTLVTDGKTSIGSGSMDGTGAEGLSKSLTLQIGDTSDSYNKVSVKVDSMDSASLGLADVNIGSQAGASAAVKLINNAINKVSSQRGDLGAIQNRLEHTINNLGVTEENMTSAESRIRDTDMAKEMMQYTKNNILVQASQSMLAQANQLPQGVLQLLG